MYMREYFCGQYFKCQSDAKSLAVIPAVHAGSGQKSYSIQLITGNGAWNADFSCGEMNKSGEILTVGESSFSKSGARISVKTPEVWAEGELFWGRLAPPKYDIMGPFCFVPFMECRHSVYSMKHSVNGKVSVNGEEFIFEDGTGYIEGDRGRSFPKKYLWTQYCFDRGSVMLSAADIPILGRSFTGVIGFVLLDGKEYRIATYLGARLIKLGSREISVLQGDRYLAVKMPEAAPGELRAPCRGKMSRTVRENLSCSVYYCFRKGGETLFEAQAQNASFEYEYPR